MKRFLYATALAALQLLNFGAQASTVEFSPAAQAGVEWHYGASLHAANHASLHFAVGYTPTYGEGLQFSSERVVQGDSPQLQQHGVLPLVDARISTAPGMDAFRIAGFSVLTQPSSQDAVNGSDQSWLSHNWGWVLLWLWLPSSPSLQAVAEGVVTTTPCKRINAKSPSLEAVQTTPVAAQSEWIAALPNA